ncbi:MAG: signal recognition particle receptor subunit alpha, partial [Bacillota bacterium]
MSFFNRLKNGLSKTRSGLVTRLNELLVGNREITEELYDELEEILIQADVGVQTTLKLVQNLRQLTKENKLKKAAEVRQSLMAEIEKTLTLEENSLNVNKSGLTVIMVVGVNG